MSVNRTDPTIASNYVSFPYVVKTTKWQQTAVKVAAIIAHILLSIITAGIFTLVTAGKYFAEKRNVSRISVELPQHTPNLQDILDRQRQEEFDIPQNNTRESLTTRVNAVQNLNKEVENQRINIIENEEPNKLEKQTRIRELQSSVSAKQELLKQNEDAFHQNSRDLREMYDALNVSDMEGLRRKLVESQTMTQSIQGCVEQVRNIENFSQYLDKKVGKTVDWDMFFMQISTLAMMNAGYEDSPIYYFDDVRFTTAFTDIDSVRISFNRSIQDGKNMSQAVGSITSLLKQLIVVDPSKRAFLQKAYIDLVSSMSKNFAGAETVLSQMLSLNRGHMAAEERTNTYINAVVSTMLDKSLAEKVNSLLAVLTDLSDSFTLPAETISNIDRQEALVSQSKNDFDSVLAELTQLRIDLSLLEM